MRQVASSWPLRLTLVFVLLIAAACRQEPQTGGSDNTRDRPGEYSLERAAAPYRGTTIRVIGEALPPLKALDQISKDFENATGIAVEIEGFDYDLMIERATLDVSSATGRYDIVLLAPEAWGRLAASDRLFPLEHFVEDQSLRDPTVEPAEQLFEKAWKDLGWYQGTAYGYPFSVLTMNLWYRKDLLSDPVEQRRFLERYGYELRVPQTWEEYRDIAEFFTRPTEGLYGTLIQGKRHPALWQEWLNFAFSFGGGTLEKENAWEYGSIVVDCPATVEATKYYKGLLPFAPPGTLEYTWDDALAAMQQGQVFMAIMWTDMAPAVEDPEASTVAGKLGYAPLPAGARGSVSQISGSAYLIPRTARTPEAAYLFIQWLMHLDNQVRLHLAGGQSGVKTVYEDPRVAKLPYAQGIFDTISRGISMRETVPEAPAIGEAVQIGLSQILHGKRTVEDGLNWIAGELESLLSGRASSKCEDERLAA